MPMSSIELPLFGKGSQPSEEDGAVLEYLALPQAMETFEMPSISVDAPLQALQPAKQLLQRLLAGLEHFAPDQAITPLTLIGLDADNRNFIDELLGEGEVSILYGASEKLRIQESVLAGVWRLQQFDSENQVIADWLEVAVIPEKIQRYSFEEANAFIDTDFKTMPEGVMNAPPLLTELNAKIAEYRQGAEPYVINLSLLPQSEQDLAFLTQRLGGGRVTILSRGYGNCRISSTAARNVWWVQYFNSEDTLILNTLEVTPVPSVACASVEDIEDSRERLQEILNVYL